MSFAAENQDRFEDIYRQHFRAVYKYCVHRIGPDRADDAVQETFLAVLASFDRLPDDPARQRYWIIDRARDACKKVLRSQLRQDRLRFRLSAQPTSSGPDVAAGVAVRDELERLLRSVGIRSELDRDVVVLAISGYSAGEVGVLMGLSTSAVETRLSRLRRRLRDKGANLNEGLE